MHLRRAISFRLGLVWRKTLIERSLYKLFLTELLGWGLQCPDAAKGAARKEFRNLSTKSNLNKGFLQAFARNSNGFRSVDRLGCEFLPASEPLGAGSVLGEPCDDR